MTAPAIRLEEADPPDRPRNASPAPPGPDEDSRAQRVAPSRPGPTAGAEAQSSAQANAPSRPVEVPGIRSERQAARRPREAAGAPSRSRGPAPGVAHAKLVRTRCLAFGGLTGLVLAVAVIFANAFHRPAASPLTPAAARIAHHPRYWTIRAGQSFASIAQRENTSAAELERLNPRLQAGRLAPGQRVLLPG